MPLSKDEKIWKCFLALLIIMPIPFGLNTGWAWPVVGAAVFLLLTLKLIELLRLRYQQQLTDLPTPEPFRKASPLLLLLLAAHTWAGIQLLSGLSMAPHDTFINLIKGLSYTGCFALTLLLLSSHHRVEQIIWTLVISASIQSVYGVFMVLSGMELTFIIEKTDFRNTATGTYINRNHLAGYLEMSIACGVGLLLARTVDYQGNFRQRLRAFLKAITSNKIILRMLLVIMVIAMVMTRSRMGNTAFFSSLLVTGLLALFLMKQKTITTTILLSSLLVIDVLIVGTFFGMEKLVERLETTTSEAESRDEVTLSTLGKIIDTPLTGIGAGAFTYAFPTFKHENVTTTKIYNNTHNDYAQFAVEYGLPVFAILLATVLISLWWSVSAMSKRRNRFHQGVGFGATMALIAIGVHSFVDFNLQIPANAFTFMLILALAANARWGSYKATA